MTDELARSTIVEPHRRAMADVDELARVLFEETHPGAWSRATWTEQRYWRGVAAKVLDSGWRRS